MRSSAATASVATTVTGKAPAAFLEHAETIDDGLRLEVFEETGLKVEPEALTGVYQNFPRKIVALVFRCRAIDGQLTVNPEASDFGWVTADEARSLLTDAYAVRVTDALSHTSEASPAGRWHDGAAELRQRRRLPFVGFSRDEHAHRRTGHTLGGSRQARAATSGV